MYKSDDLRKILGDNIRHHRMKLGMTQDEFSDKLGLTFVSVSKIENGHSWLKCETFAKITEILNVKPFELFLQTEEDLVRYKDNIISAVSEILDKTLTQLIGSSKGGSGQLIS